MKKVERKKTILLIDDEDMILDIGEIALRRWGYNVISADSGKKALQIYEEERDHIDLVLLDMILGDINGNEVYKRLKKIKPDVKVLLASGYGMDGNVKKAMDSGRNCFLEKPLNMAELSETIGRLLTEA